MFKLMKYREDKKKQYNKFMLKFNKNDNVSSQRAIVIGLLDYKI